MQTLLKKIIRAGIGRWRYTMAITGMGIAVLFILISVQIHANFKALLYGKNNQNETADFLVIHKKITPEIQGKKSASQFTEADVALLKTQPFIESVAGLSASHFKVSVESYSDRLPFYSEAFFESVPNEFIDVKSENWTWQEGQKSLPVILPSFFLDLYNTGMALSDQNLPQLSLEAIMALPVKITVRGNGISNEYTGHVVGLSDRINSILIPQDFMNWANAEFGYQQKSDPTRVVIKVKDPTEPKLVDFLNEKQWDTNAEKTRFSRIRKIVNGVVAVTGGIGLLLLFFGMLVFSLFVQLTIAACKTEINLLQTLGTSPVQLRRFLMKQFFPINALIVLLGLAFTAIAQKILQSFLAPKQMNIPSFISLQTIVAAAFILFILWWVIRGTIGKYISGKRGGSINAANMERG